MADSCGRLEDSPLGPFYSILAREAKEARANLRTRRKVIEIQCETIFLFVLSLYTKFTYFINNLIGQGRHVIEDVEKGKVKALKKYCEVNLAAYESFMGERAELMRCMDLFIEHDLLTMRLTAAASMWAEMLGWGDAGLRQIKQDIPLVVQLLKEDLMKMFEMNLEPELENLTATEKLDKISRNVGRIQRSAVNTVEAITHEMYNVLEYGDHLKKSSCFNDYLCHHKLEGSFKFSSFTRPLPKLWMCSKCWQWNKNELLYTNTQSAACEHCGQPIIPDTIDAQNLHNAMKYGSIEYCVCTAIIQGEARAGKTCVKSLLLSKPYESLSTNCIEAPVIGTFSVERYSTNSSCSTGKECWAVVEEEEMTKKIVAELQTVAKTRKNSVPSLKPYISISEYHSEAGDRATLKVGPNTPGEVQEKAVTAATKTEEESSNSSDTVTNQFYKPVSTESQDSQEVKRLGEHRDWLYLIDSGGQIQFQKLLPAFMPFVSVLILVVNVAKSLSDFSSTSMKLKNEVINVDKRSLKVEEVLKQLLLAIVSASTRHTMDMSDLLQYVEPPPEEMNIIAIATHHDKYEELLKEGKEIEKIEKKEEKLEDILKPIEKACKIVYKDADNHKLFHEVDGRKAEKGEYDDPVIAQISSKLKDQAYKVKVPLKWHCFGDSLRKEASKGCGVMSLSHCQDISRMLHMSPDEVVTCLKFFHMLNMLLYYPNSPAKDIVFVQLDSIIDILKDLMVMVSRDRPRWTRASTEVMDFVTGGTVSIEILKKSKKCAAITQVFPDFESLLLGVFEHILIAAPLQEEGRFLMPAILPTKDISDIKPFPSTVPLLFYFEKSVPMGLFCATIVNLLSLKFNEEKKWCIIRTEDNWSNHLTIEKRGVEGSIILVEGLDCFEVHAQQPTFKVTDDIKDALEFAVKQRKLAKLEKIPRAFHCPCGKTPPHMAIVEGNEESGIDITFRCILTKRTVEIKEGKKWFRNRQGLLPYGLKDKLNETHAQHILPAIKDLVTEWKIVATYLGLSSAEVSTIDEQSRGNVAQCRREMIITWLKKPDPTREALVDALKDAGKNDIAVIVKRL